MIPSFALRRALVPVSPGLYPYCTIPVTLALIASVASFDGLTVEYARQIGANFLIRGLRTITDFEYEVQLCQTNQVIAPDIDTVFLSTRPEHNFISSSIVKELSNYKTDISKFVPKNVVEYLQDDLRKVLK